MPTSLLFAYGTLMPRDAATAALEGSSADAVRGRLYDLGPYPALIDLDDPAAGWVEGYVKVVLPADLEAHDRWEEVDEGTYRRAQTTTRDGRRAWVYVYNRALPEGARGPLPCWHARATAR
jgi:gamma-glutamylcyclotransferase (GGCT)/AIG2-like uncharacterized protein YtfP